MNLKKSVLFICVLCAMMCMSICAQAGIMLEYDNGVHEYTGSLYTLRVNGSEVKTPLEPIIFNDRALVPIREVFEAMGAVVGYDKGDVSVTMNGINVSLSINDPVAEINGAKKTIPDGIVPKLIARQGESAKTMVPVRFISESIGMDVEFDGDDGIINVNSPTASLSNVTYTAPTSKKLVIRAKIDGSVNEIKHFTLKEPTRVVVDIANTTLDVKNNTIKINEVGVQSIRLGETDGTSRIVADLTTFKDYKVEKQGDEVVITILTNGEPAPTPKPTAAPTPKPTAAPTVTPTAAPSESAKPARPVPNETVKPNETAAPTSAPKPTMTPKPIPPIAQDGEKIIVLDAGHGGRDGGADGKLGGMTIYEKDLTLSIAKKTEKILKDAGYSVVMTRDEDIYPTLTERSDLANKIGAAMFVSIHINAADSSSAAGTEVYYSVKNNSDTYGTKSEVLAKNILDEMLSRMGTHSRGVKTANHVVTRTSMMPAVLAEVGFISNTAELSKMCDESFQQATAEGIAAGIMKTYPYIQIPTYTTEEQSENAEVMAVSEENNDNADTAATAETTGLDGNH